MSEPEQPTRIDSFQLTLRMDATLTVNGDQWLKPGAEGSITWRGHEWGGEWQDPIPSEEELKIASKMIQAGIVGPILEEMIALSQRRVVEMRQGK